MGRGAASWALCPPLAADTATGRSVADEGELPRGLSRGCDRPFTRACPTIGSAWPICYKAQAWPAPRRAERS